MHRFLLCTFLFLTLSSLTGQQKVLFVDDSGDQFSNSQYLASALDSLGVEYYYYDANGLNQSPLAEEMLEFDLVIWHTSTWGVGLHLWNTDKTVNTEVQNYLRNPNARFWLIGNDFLYDRYGAAPVTFQEGDFAYDYLGLAAYKAQSYVDDNGIGLESAVPDETSPIDLNDLGWSVGNLWYADALALRDEGQPVYRMKGQPGYALNDEITGYAYHEQGKAHVLVYGFDLSLASGFEMMKNNIDQVLRYFRGLADTKKIRELNANVTVFPNPTTGMLNIKYSSQMPQSDLKIELVTLTGDRYLLDQFSVIGNDLVIQVDLSELIPPGIYLLQISVKDAVKTLKVILL